MKIGTKLIIGFLVVALLVGVVGYFNQNKSLKKVDEIGEIKQKRCKNE